MPTGAIDPIKDEQTPLMQQYFRIKNEHPEALLLFQVGDFYELFFDDAKCAAACLGIALTARGKVKGEPIPLCGVPVHSLDHYLTRLIKAGFKVAICNQLEQAVLGKMVARGVTQVLTPGTLTDSRLLDEKSASYLLSFFPMADGLGLLFGELLTAQIFVTVLDPASAERLLETEVARFYPDEIIIPQEKLALSYQPFFKKLGYFTSLVPAVADASRQFDQSATSFLWQEESATQSMAAFNSHESLRIALFYFHAYLQKNQVQALGQAWQVQLYKAEDFLQLDASTQRNLELVTSVGGRMHSLLGVLDCAITPMGSRLIKKWLLRPLVNSVAIAQRHDAVGFLMSNVSLSQECAQLLKKIGDFERVVGRIALRRAQLHDYQALAQVLSVVPLIKELLVSASSLDLLTLIASYLDGLERLYGLLRAAFSVQGVIGDQTIAIGFDSELDQLRAVVESNNQELVVLEQQEQQRTGINSLKIGYSQLHGYYFEVSKANTHLVPADYIRYQTLVGKERYISALLQHLQQQQLNARAQIKQAEERLYERIKQEVAQHLHKLRTLSHALAHLDALFAFCQIARTSNYVRPVFNQQREITIAAGRHPVVERVCLGSFIPNDTIMHDQASFFMVTGPNMGGKSTYLRQVALISLLAQCGSFVPATHANVFILDRIFTRIGAGDNLAQGKSTFLVEMEETATICMQATKNSLVILDEVGRGTSTFDGLAIAQAVVEYLYEKIQARALFATHYHELTRLSDRYEGIVNCYAASKKTDRGILFLYKMITGVADGSFGIEVARLAQLPGPIVARARQLVDSFVAHDQLAARTESAQEGVAHHYQPALRSEKSPKELAQELNELKYAQELKQRLLSVDCDQITPRQALDLLWQLRQEIKQDC